MTGEFLLLSAAADLLPKNLGKPIHVNTLRRWVAVGVAVGGRRVRLKAERVGVRYYTTREWVEEFKTDCLDRREPPEQIERVGLSPSTVARLQARGFHVGIQKSDVVSGVRGRKGAVQGPVPALQSKRALQNQNGASHRAAVNRHAIDAPQGANAAVGIRVETAQGVS